MSTAAETSAKDYRWLQIGEIQRGWLSVRRRL